MLLRLIDQPSASAIQVNLQAEDQTITFTIDDFSSPISAAFYENLSWYFEHYLQLLNQPVDDRNVGEGLLRKGLSLGDSLIGEDFELMKVSDRIETEGFAKVRVQVESARIEFFETFWELLILSDAKYVLSTVCQGFVRRFTGADQSDYEEELNHKLHGDTGPEADDAAPLGVLHIIACSADDSRPINGFNASTRSLRWMGAVDYTLWPYGTLEALRERLSETARSVHCVHYDGPVHVLNGMPHIFFGVSGAPLALDAVCRLLVENKIALLTVDACTYLDETQQPVNIAQGLATIARVATEAGLGNVVGLGYRTDPWTAGGCFECFYDKLLLGLSISQAVVETRKQLQAQPETKRFRVEGLPFHVWPLPVHYGGQPVRFFGQPQQAVELMQSPAFQRTHQRLFGFQSQYLPPDAGHCEDQGLLALLTAAQEAEGCVLSLIGPSGSGKTHLVHQVGFYRAQQQRMDYGFYFDVGTGFYSFSDVQQMIAPVFDCEADDTEKLDTALREHRCYFVFDNLDTPTLSQWPEVGEAAIAELIDYLTRLAQGQHSVVVTGRDRLEVLDTKSLRVEPLHPLSQQVLAAGSLREGSVDTGGMDWLPLLECLQGNPFLIQKVLPQLAHHKCEELVATVKSWPEAAQSDPVGQYYRWQWSRLDVPWQRLLRQVADLPSVPLEMLTLACRQIAAPADKGPDTDEGDSSEVPKSTWTEPATKLFTQLGVPLEGNSTGFNAAQDHWQRAGLLLKRPYGTLVDPRFAHFMARSLKEDSDSASTVDPILLSRILCVGIGSLAQHLQQQQNPLMSQYLLANRRHWVKHFEVLWFGRCYRDFVRVKQAFDSLLRTVRLEGESTAWTLDLLGRTPMVTTPENLESAAAWLRLAYHVLAADKDAQAKLLTDAAAQWKEWLLLQTVGEKLHPCFRLAAQWLAAFYQLQEQWAICYEISERVYHHDRHHQQWPFVIEALKRLAQCSVALKDEAKAIAYETSLLDELPFDQLPPNLRTQLILQVAGARVARGESQLAQPLVTQLREAKDARALGSILDSLQADIDYQQERYPEALNGYCKLWEAAKAGGQPGGADRAYLQQRLKDLEEKLGEERFDVVCQQTLGHLIDLDEPGGG